jgi:prepilin-type N-terminal cleavage/methylation domain-containing protein
MNMKLKFLVFSFEFLETQIHSVRAWLLKTQNAKLKTAPGFTLIETMVAISLLTIAIVAPMLLTVQSLKSAYYARDQVTAFYLAQEAIETVHAARDANILKIAQGQSGVNIFDGIPSISGQPFTVDGPSNTMTLCSGKCAQLQIDPTGTLYEYGPYSCSNLSGGWTCSIFTRTATACYVQPSPSTLCNGTVSDEVRVSVTVSWQTGTYTQRSFTLSEDLYRWVQNGSGA